MSVAELVPADLIDWTPGAGIMTIGDLLRHVAVCERWLFVEIASGGRSLYKSHGQELARSREEILHLMRALHEESLNRLAALTPDAWQRPVITPGGRTMAAHKWLRAMVEHEAHHRGQLYLLLRLCGIETPPIFGMTSEQVRRIM